MLIPKKVKHRKWQRGGIRGSATSKTNLDFGSFGLQATENGMISSRQIEAARRAMTRFFQKGGKIWIRIFPDKPVTLHGSEVRMGGGKGGVDHYVAVVKRGTIMFEMDGVTEAVAREAIRLAAHKMSVMTRFIKKETV
jgi:large subunit ribosomal protein L16